MSTIDTPALSVVVARAPGGSARITHGPPRWLSALDRECAGIASELLLVGFPPAEAASFAAAPGAPRRVLVDAHPAALSPVRWGLGLAAARGHVVAFTTDLCIVGEGWARAALAAIADGFVAVGGPIQPMPALSRTGLAVHQLRFGRLPAARTRVVVDDVAADNAAYDRALLVAEGGDMSAGFWEVEPNRRLHAAGHRLVFDGSMIASFAGGERLRGLLGQRFRHGRQAGAWRVAAGKRRPWQIVLASPLVPLVLLVRAMRRARGDGRSRLLRVAPEFLALATAWAAGEAAGAIDAAAGRVRSSARL